MFGGLPLIIDNLPFDCPSRNYYVRLFVEMAEAVRATQCRDGDWRTSCWILTHIICLKIVALHLCVMVLLGGSVMVIYSNVLINLYLKRVESLVKAVHADGKLGIYNRLVLLRELRVLMQLMYMELVLFYWLAVSFINLLNSYSQLLTQTNKIRLINKF